MRSYAVSAIVLSVVTTLGCGGAPTTGPAAPGGPDACEAAPAGPLVGYTYDMTPPAKAQGGPIADGIYDLTQMVAHDRASGPWSSNEAPALRWAMKITTEDRVVPQGRLVTAMNIPPALDCVPGRFATVGTELRVQSAARPNKLDSSGYTATPDGRLVLVLERATFVFQRRR